MRDETTGFVFLPCNFVFYKFSALKILGGLNGPMYLKDLEQGLLYSTCYIGIYSNYNNFCF